MRRFRVEMIVECVDCDGQYVDDKLFILLRDCHHPSFYGLRILRVRVRPA